MINWALEWRARGVLEDKVDVAAKLLHTDIKKLPSDIIAAVDAPLEVGGKSPDVSCAGATALAGDESSPNMWRDFMLKGFRAER
jgi:hypothetical protein